jgi:flagellar biosynthesis protein FliQ
MKYCFTPNICHNIAISLYEFRWWSLLWSGLTFALFIILQQQINQSTPNTLVWLSIFILFVALQALVVGSFIFFFQALASIKERQAFWVTFYRAVEWSEAIIFSFILPLPMLLFFYALFSVQL